MNKDVLSEQKPPRSNLRTRLTGTQRIAGNTKERAAETMWDCFASLGGVGAKYPPNSVSDFEAYRQRHQLTCSAKFDPVLGQRFIACL